VYKVEFITWSKTTEKERKTAVCWW